MRRLTYPILNLENFNAMTKKTVTLKDKDGNEKEYWTVPSRRDRFWSDNPNGSIETESRQMTDGKYAFKATIMTDRTGEVAKKATGHALGDVTGDKAYEMLETVAVGRALGMIGYPGDADGSIAGVEEMALHNDKKEKKVRDEASVAISAIKRTKSVETLKKKFMSLGNLMNNVEVIAVKDEHYKKLTTIN